MNSITVHYYLSSTKTYFMINFKCNAPLNSAAAYVNLIGVSGVNLTFKANPEMYSVIITTTTT